MKFPANAKKVRDYIRLKVKRPKTLPIIVSSNSATRKNLYWKKGRLKRWNLDWGHDKDQYCCPLGLLPNSSDPLPMSLDDIDFSNSNSLPFNDLGIKEFYEWWDNQTSPKSAVNTVWGISN